MSLEANKYETIKLSFCIFRIIFRQPTIVPSYQLDAQLAYPSIYCSKLDAQSFFVVLFTSIFIFRRLLALDLWAVLS